MTYQTQTSPPITVEIFISYSQEDREYMEELKKHLRLFERQGLVCIWADTDIQCGKKWSTEIKEKLEDLIIDSQKIELLEFVPNAIENQPFTFNTKHNRIGENKEPILLHHFIFDFAAIL